MRGVFLSLLLVLAACGPDDRPKPSAARKVAADHPQKGAVWPSLLQHCLRKPDCDPLSNFGEGAGQASGQAGSVAWFVESKDVVREGGQDYGAAITLSVFGPRGTGGPGGRPLALEEVPNSLRGVNARRTRLSIEYRTPGDGPLEPYSLVFRSAQVVISAPGAAEAKTQEELMAATSRYLEGIKWGDSLDETGVKIDIRADKERVYGGYSSGIAAADFVTDAEAKRRKFEPWMFFLIQNIRDEPEPKLMKALEAGKTLSMKIVQAQDAVVLEDGFYADGYAEALKQAVAALADPELAKPLTDRCANLRDKDDAFWLKPDISPVYFACDPRTPEQRRTDEVTTANTSRAN